MRDAIIISDLHLGSDNCQAKALSEFLEELRDDPGRPPRLILNGDVFDSIDFRRLKKSHWKVLSLLRKLSDEMEIVWIVGNHDGSADIISHLLGVTVVENYVLESCGRRIAVLHGHTFDDFIDRHPFLTFIADSVYWVLQLIDPSHRIARFAKRTSKIFLRCAEKIRDKSREHARRQRCDAICCGHTHHAAAEADVYPAYFNSGCWTELPCHYLMVEDGVVELRTYGKVQSISRPSYPHHADPSETYAPANA